MVTLLTSGPRPSPSSPHQGPPLPHTAPARAPSSRSRRT
jgi:hypothetical protein